MLSKDINYIKFMKQHYAQQANLSMVQVLVDESVKQAIADQVKHDIEQLYGSTIRQVLVDSKDDILEQAKVIVAQRLEDVMEDMFND